MCALAAASSWAQCTACRRDASHVGYTSAMEGMASRLTWFTIVAIAVAYGSYLVAGNIVNAQAAGRDDPVLIRDELAPNQHRLSGMVMVPSPCDQLSVTAQELSATNYALIFKTWREPSVTCDDDQTPRTFRTIVFAPAAGVYFSATLDGRSLPIAVVPYISGSAQ